jgi:hypothetical protein
VAFASGRVHAGQDPCSFTSGLADTADVLVLPLQPTPTTARKFPTEISQKEGDSRPKLERKKCQIVVI